MNPEPEGVQLEIVREGRVVVAVIAGELDHDGVQVVEDRLDGVVADEVVGLVCDLRDVRYLDSAALHLLHRVERRLRERGHRIVAVEPERRTPAKVLRITGLDVAVPLHPTRAEAVAALASSA